MQSGEIIAGGGLGISRLFATSAFAPATATSVTTSPSWPGQPSRPPAAEPGSGSDPGPAEVVDRYVGVYELDGGGTVIVTRSSDRLMAAATGLGSTPLYAQTPTEFTVHIIPVSVTVDAPGSGLVLHHAGRHWRARRAS